MYYYSIRAHAKFIVNSHNSDRIYLLTEISDKLYKFVDGVFPKVEPASFDVTRKGYLVLCG